MQQAQLSFDPEPLVAAAPAPVVPLRVTPPQLLVKWTPFWPNFLENVTNFARGRDLPVVITSSSPGTFWSDVFVQRPLPWKEFAQSGVLHVLGAIFIALTGHLWLGKRSVGLEDPLSHSTISYYETEDFLPAFKTPAPRPVARVFSKHDPAPATQEVVSIPSDADNSEQTIANLAHPEILRQNVPLPNLIVNSTQPKFAPKMPKLTAPLLAFHPVMPTIERAPAEAAKHDVYPEPVPVEAKEIVTRRDGEVEIASDQKPVDAPKLALPEQAKLPKLDVAQPDVAPAVPSASAVGEGPASGQLLALSVRPIAPLGDIKVPDGSRKGAFATSPIGREGAAGTPGVEPSAAPVREIASGGRLRDLQGSGASGPEGGMPAGIAISGGKSQELGNALSGTRAPEVQVQRTTPKMIADAPSAVRNTLVAAADIPRQRTIPPPAERKPDDVVFGTKRVYSMQINLPNLTSAGGSWIIHFAEMGDRVMPGELSTPVATSKVDPAYPPTLQHDGVQGVVVLYAVIHVDGTVGEIRVLHGLHDRLDENAIRALARWKFRPATKSGEPVALEAVVQIPFYAHRGF